MPLLLGHELVETKTLDRHGCIKFEGAEYNGGGNPLLIPESTTVAVCVIIAWLVVWTALGAWRMMTRDA